MHYLLTAQNISETSVIRWVLSFTDGVEFVPLKALGPFPCFIGTQPSVLHGAHASLSPFVAV
jgi:hypothetical protein